MEEEFNFINTSRPYPLNSRYSNLYYNDKQFHTQNNFYINEDINLNSRNETDIPNSNSKMNNILSYRSPIKKHKDDGNLNSKENIRLQKENISLFSSLKKAEAESRLKDAEINRYKQKMKALFKQVKDKNNILYDKNNLILQLFEEQETRMNQGQNLNEVENAIRLSNYKINKYKNKNKELLNQISKKDKYIKNISKEKIQLKKYISKIQNDYNKIKEDSAEKDNQIKSLFNFFKRRRNNSYKDNIVNTQTYSNSNNKLINIILNSSNNLTENNVLTTASNNQLNNQNSNLKNSIIDKNISNKFKSNFDDQLDIYKYSFTIENKNKLNNNYLNRNNSVEIQKYENEKYISELKKEVNDSNLKNKNFERIIQNKEREIKNLESQNNILRKDLKTQKEEKRNLKLQYDLLLNNLNKNEINKNKTNLENNKKIENLIIEKNKNENKIKDLLSTIEEDKNKIKILNENLLNKKEEILSKNNSYKNLESKLTERNKEYEKLLNSLSKLKEENANKNKCINDFKKEINKIQEYNENIKKEINDKNDTILILRKSINDLNNNIQKLKEENDEIKNEKIELAKKIQEINDKAEIENKNKNEKESKNNEIKKENSSLLRTNSQLNEYITELNQKLNSLQLKYQENKKKLNEKESIIKDLEDVSKALLEKQKTDLEKKDKNEHISPNTHLIITKKHYNKLTWYLVTRLNLPEGKKNNYDEYKWVTENVIPSSQLSKYNKFKEEDSNLNNNSYIKRLYRQLEQKEEEVNKLNYKNKKLNEKIQNKSSSVKNNKLFINKFMDNTEKTGMNKSNSNKNILNTEGNQGSNSLIDKIINYYDSREINYKNEITELENKLKDTEKLQSNTNNIKGISFINQSDFMDDADNMMQFFKEKNIIKKKESNSNDLGILKDVPGNESDLDEIKGLQTLTKYLKKDNREKEKKFNNLAEKIKELIKKLKFDDKIKPQISEILLLIGFNENDIKNIINNNKGFFLEKNK